MGVVISKKAKDWLKKSSGLPKRSWQKYVDTVYRDGVKHTDITGSASRYLTSLYFRGSASDFRGYNGNVFLFAGDNLIAVHQLPLKYRNVFIKEKV